MRFGAECARGALNHTSRLTNPQRVDPSQGHVPAPAQQLARIKFEARVAGQKLAQGDRDLHPGQGRAQAEVADYRPPKPVVAMPSTKYFWASKNRRIIGMTMTVDAAKTSSHWEL